MGSFALGYLMGMTLSGPNYTPDGYGDNFDEKELKRINDEMYWNAWDTQFKNKVIERLRDKGEPDFDSLLNFRGKPIYPELTPDMQADLIESGELKLLSVKKPKMIVAIWADENREEAKNPIYLQYLARAKEDISKENARIVS